MYTQHHISTQWLFNSQKNNVKWIICIAYFGSLLSLQQAQYNMLLPPSE